MLKFFKVCLFLFMLTLVSCIKDGKTSMKYIYINNSSTNIRVCEYINGTVDSNKIRVINPGEKIVYSSDFSLGKISPIFFFPDYGDSTLVIWNNEYEVLYIADSVSYTGNRKVIDTTSNRSVCKKENYNIKVVDESKISIDYEFEFTFTEADYDYAKE